MVYLLFWGKLKQMRIWPDHQYYPVLSNALSYMPISTWKLTLAMTIRVEMEQYFEYENNI